MSILEEIKALGSNKIDSLKWSNIDVIITKIEQVGAVIDAQLA